MPSLKHRLDRLDALIPKPVVPPPEVAEHRKRVRKIHNLNLRLLEAAWSLFSDEEHKAIVAGWEAFVEKRNGPLASWLRSLKEGTSRLPKLTPECTAALFRAWLSPEVDTYVHVCRQCGLATPDQKKPPTSEWKLLPGRRPHDGLPPPWYDLPRFFTACPHCGADAFDFDYEHNVKEKDLAWKKLDGFAGPEPDWRAW